MRRLTILLSLSVFASVLVGASPAFGAEPSIGDYTSYPIFQVSTVAPNILIILDNSDSMNDQAYYGDYVHTTKYYGYFEPDKKYRYASNIFVRDTSGAWDGNFLNWLTMRRIDVARKVLMGGLATARQGTGNQTNIGETPPAGSAYDSFEKVYNDTDGVTPFPSGEGYTYSYRVEGGNFSVNDNNELITYVIRVDKNMNTHPDEAYNFVDGNIAGLLQKIGDKARWGNEFFNYGTGSGKSGGYIASTIGTNMVSLITDLQNTACNTLSPLAEAYYVAMQYFKQQEVQSGLDYPNNAIPNDNVGDDPFYNGIEFVHCAKSFVILLTDGASTYDMRVPDFLKDYDGDGHDPGTYPNSGTDYLDDIALYARTNDLRSDLAGDQNLILYTIYAFGNDPAAEALLKEAAKNGGFIDRNGNNSPDLREEWDADNDEVPDTYYRAEDAYLLEAKILRAINEILARAASGTAVSVLATSAEGEGNLVQAYYRPKVITGLSEVEWLGYLQSLWVDTRGNLREDSDQDHALDVEKDKVITYFSDPATGDTMVKRFTVSATNPYPDVTSDPYELLDLNEIIPLWEAGGLLALRDPAERKIFTFVDKDGDGQVDEASTNPFDDTGELIRFHTSSAASIKPYLGVRDTTWAYLGSEHDTRVATVIDYIRGSDMPNLRSRTINGSFWKLGDIVNSTPVSISRPPDNYHVIYHDQSYQTYYSACKDRETAVYVGANDGMLHAFTSWYYDTETMSYTRPSGAPTSENIGDELWAYIPQSLLAHLKWLPSPDYTHVYYVDLKPKVFDAKILPDDTHYTDSDTDDNWGTILLCGLNKGGKHIQAQDDFNYDGTVGVSEIRDFYPSYACLDVTDPRNPRLLWERTYTDLELSTSIPAVVRVKDKWFAIFGSGPSDYDGTSTKKGHIFVVDLKTGNPYRSGTHDWLFESAESSAFMNSPASLDKDLNYNIDAIYFGETYLQGGSWKGKVYKISIPWDWSDISSYGDNPFSWICSTLFDATRPITTSATLSKDSLGNVWVYAGTGRYFSTEDKTNEDTQYIFGIKDPFFNSDRTTYYHNYTTSLELEISDLFDADSYMIVEGGYVYRNETYFGSWNLLLGEARNYDGWIRSLTIPKERIITRFGILGGVVFTPSFVPKDDVCGFGGDSYLYGQYYETGTAYYKSVFDQGISTLEIEGQEMKQVLDKIELGPGKASSLGIHVGMEEGATGFVQQSTGNILIEGLSPAFDIKSALRSWREK